MLLTAHCGHGTAPSAVAAAPGKTSASVAPAACAPPGHLSRQEVTRVIADGPPAFLQKIDVEPRADRKGAFVGWRIVALRDPTWQQGPLRPGDVVRSVNGRSIETPYQFFDVFQSLAAAPELTLHVERQGDTRTLRWAIDGAPSSASSAEATLPARPGPSAPPRGRSF